MEKTRKITEISARLGLVLVIGCAFMAPLAVSAATRKNVELTQTSAVLGLGQKITIISTNSKSVKVTSSSRAVRATVSGGNQITIYGKSVGNAKVNVCSSGFNCTGISVKVQKTKDAVLVPSKTNLTMKVGESVSLTTKNGNNITARSNFSGVRASVVDSRIVVNALWAGKSTITVCSSNRGCVPVYVRVQTPPRVLGEKVKANEPARGLLVSRTSVTMQNQQSADVTVESRDTLTAVSDSSVARTAVNSNRITIYGSEVGTANVKICDSHNACVTVRVKVAPSNSGVFEVSPRNIVLESGESALISTKNRIKITASANNYWTARTVVKNNLVMVTGASAGKAVVGVCSGNECVPVYVTVKPAAVQRQVSGTWKTVSLDIGQTLSFQIPRNEPTSYYLSKHNNPDAVTLELNGKTVTLKGQENGTALIEICPLIPDFSCGTIGVNISKKLYCSSSSKTLQLSETIVTVKRGASFDIFASLCNDLFVVSDSEEIARATINGSRVTLYGMGTGETAITVCTSKLECTSARVKVTN